MFISRFILLSAYNFSKIMQKVLTKYEQYVNIILYTHVNVNKLLTNDCFYEVKYEKSYERNR